MTVQSVLLCCSLYPEGNVGGESGGSGGGCEGGEAGGSEGGVPQAM